MRVLTTVELDQATMDQFPQVEFTLFNGDFDEIQNPDEAEVLISVPSKLKMDTVKKLKNLKWLQLAASGYDCVDMEYIRQKGIVLTTANSINSVPVAEDAIAKMFALAKNTKHYIDCQREHKWDRLPLNFEFEGKVLGVLGVGMIGKELAKKCKLAFDMQVIGYSRSGVKPEFFDAVYAGPDGLKAFLNKSDFVVMLVPYSKESHEMMNLAAFEQMKKSAYYINMARGGVTNQNDLIKALNEGVIAGAAVDVTTPEPLPSDSPLWDAKNLIITPHHAGLCEFRLKRVYKLCAHNLNCYLNNQEMMHVVK